MPKKSNDITGIVPVYSHDKQDMLNVSLRLCMMYQMRVKKKGQTVPKGTCTTLKTTIGRVPKRTCMRLVQRVRHLDANNTGKPTNIKRGYVKKVVYSKQQNTRDKQRYSPYQANKQTWFRKEPLNNDFGAKMATTGTSEKNKMTQQQTGNLRGKKTKIIKIRTCS